MKEGHRKGRCIGVREPEAMWFWKRAGTEETARGYSTSPGLCAPAQANLIIIVLLWWCKPEVGEPPGAPETEDDHQWQRRPPFKTSLQIHRVCFNRFFGRRGGPRWPTFWELDTEKDDIISRPVPFIIVGFWGGGGGSGGCEFQEALLQAEITKKL